MPPCDPRETEARPSPERRERDDDMLSLSAMSVIATDAFWAAERRGLDAMTAAGDNKQTKENERMNILMPDGGS